MKPSELFCFKDKQNFAAILFFLAACKKKIPAGKCDRYRVGWKWSTRRLVEDGMSTGLTNTHTARGFSDLYHVFARKQCILCPALRHSMLHRFEIRELKNRNDDLVDDDRKWVSVHWASATSKFRRRGVVNDAKQSRITSSCNPQASTGINPLF